MPTNDFLAIAKADDANVLSQELYAELDAIEDGFERGLLPSTQLNKVLRQTTFVAAAVATLLEQQLDVDVLDDGDLQAFVDNLADTITTIAIATSGALIYQGTWNANTNTPALASGVGTKGFLYTVSVAGATNLNGITVWNVGDKAVYNGAAWEKIEGQATEVLSVAGRVGLVVLAAADISDSSAIGRQVLQAANEPAIRALLGLGTAALNATGDFDPAGSAAAALAAALAASALRTLPTDDAGANRNLVDADRAAFVRMTNAGANTVMLSAAVLAAAPADAEWSGIQAGDGQTTLTPGGGVTFNATPGLKTRAKYSAWTIKKVTGAVADVFGDLSA